MVGEKKELDRRDRPSRRRSSPWLSTGTSLSLHLAEQSDCAKLRVRPEPSTLPSSRGRASAANGLPTR